MKYRSTFLKIDQSCDMSYGWTLYAYREDECGSDDFHDWLPYEDAADAIVAAKEYASMNGMPMPEMEYFHY